MTTGELPLCLRGSWPSRCTTPPPLGHGLLGGRLRLHSVFSAGDGRASSDVFGGGAYGKNLDEDAAADLEVGADVMEHVDQIMGDAVPVAGRSPRTMPD